MAKNVAEEVAQLRKDLKKNNDDEKMVMDILKVLANVPITREVLKVTGVGKTVNKLAQDSREAVSSAAKPILKSWKDLSKAGKSAGTPKSPPDLGRSLSNVSTGSLFAGKDGAPEDSAEGDEKQKEEEEETPKPKARGVSSLPRIPLPSDSKRARTCELLQQQFVAEQGTFGKPAVVNISAHIEKAMADALVANSADYKAKYRTLKTNFQLNPSLKEDLLTGLLSSERLVRMQDSELLSKDRQMSIQQEKTDLVDSMRQDWLDANREEIMKAVGVQIEGGLFKCKRCGSKKTTHYQKQTRSADEPMTVFIQCTQCPHRWRQ